MKSLYKYLSECGGGIATGINSTPGNTLGMGNPMADGDMMSEPLPPYKKPIAGKIPRLKKKKKQLTEQQTIDGPIQAEPDDLGKGPAKITHNRKPKEKGNKVEIE